MLVSKAALSAIVGRYDYKGPVLTVTQEGDRVFAQLGAQPKFEIQNWKGLKIRRSAQSAHAESMIPRSTNTRFV
jgi:hypothetical protein